MIVAELRFGFMYITLSPLPSILTNGTTRTTVKFYVPNATTLGIKEKPGELRGTPNVKTRAILSQAAAGNGAAEGATTRR